MLSASIGYVIEITGKRITIAKCLPPHLSDEGKGIITVNVLVRNNACIAIRDTVLVRIIRAVSAEKVIVAPLEAIPTIDERYLADALESIPLINEDNVMVPHFGGRPMFQIIGVILTTSNALFLLKQNFKLLKERNNVLKIILHNLYMRIYVDYVRIINVVPNVVQVFLNLYIYFL